MEKVRHERVLVVVAHPDDEVLGCGGTIAQHCKKGDQVKVLIVADGVTSRRYDPDHKVSRQEEIIRDKKAISCRLKEAFKACKILGIKSEHIIIMNFPDQRLDGIPILDIIKSVEMLANDYRPTVVYTHFFNDFNIDHQIVCRAVLTAFRPRLYKSSPLILMMEIAESTCLSLPMKGQDFCPDYCIDIKKTLDVKLRAIKAYQSEARKFPDPRSAEYLRQLAFARAQSSAYQAVEAFITIKEPKWVWW